METISVLYVVALLAVGMVAVRGIQATTEHYFPDSDAANVMRFLFAAP